jgi:hypothetical protein
MKKLFTLLFLFICAISIQTTVYNMQNEDYYEGDQIRPKKKSLTEPESECQTQEVNFIKTKRSLSTYQSYLVKTTQFGPKTAECPLDRLNENGRNPFHRF